MYPVSASRGRVFAASTVAPTVALIQQKVATTADGTANCTSVFDAPVTSGNSVIACISFLDTGAFDSAPGFQDGVASPLTEAVTRTATGAEVCIYYLHGLDGETTVRYSLDLPVRASINISEWSGLANAAPQDTSDATSGGSTTLGICPATLDPTTAQNLVIGIGAYAAATAMYSSGPTNSFTRLTNTGGASVWQECAYLIRSSDHAAVTSTITLSGSLASASCAAGFGAA